MAEAAARLLDFSAPFDVGLLDSTVNAFYEPRSETERAAADRVLQQFQGHEHAWRRVDCILETTQNSHTKFFALQILEEQIKYKWGRLPVEQREGIRNYVSNLIIKLCSDEAVFRREKVFLHKLNLILVHILKHEWPAKWPAFMPELVGASKTSETLCENSMHILKLLSEEIFDFHRGELTQAKTKELKKTLNEEFRLIHELCVFVLQNSSKTELLRATLEALHAYLTWIPMGYIFESNVVSKLLEAMPQAPFRNVAVRCLTEVAALQVGAEQGRDFVLLYNSFMSRLVALIPPGTDLRAAYEAGTDEEQALVQNLALFFTTFFRSHIGLLEAAPDAQACLVSGLDYLISISYVDDNEVFKTCLDYWNYFVPDVYSSVCTLDPAHGKFSFGGPAAATNRKLFFQTTLSKLRALMISRMAKPEEVIVVEDENGNIVRESLKDNDVLVQYKTMRETLVYLAHLDHEDTENQMLERLGRQQSEGRALSSDTWQSLNTLCWAIGSISGSMVEDQENRFLVTVIRDLLNLCEVTRGKDNKAVIASNIMYVVGQYPRFLRVHWKFLKTVVNKLFEFMHETHPGVQDMACDTFLKICHKCKRKFVIVQQQEKEPFICELLNNLNDTIHELQVHQIHTFYEAVGLMVLAEGDALKRRDYLARLMQPPNATWQQIISQAEADVKVLERADVIKNIQNILQTNVSVCQSLGQPFLSQLTVGYMDMLQVYKMYSELISQAISAGGPHAARTTFVRMMRSVKKATLKLIETFVEKSDDVMLVHTQLVPAMMDPVLGDYARNTPDARDAEVLSLFATIINKLRGTMEPDVPRVFEAVFECTLQMITKNFEDYPEHRLKFFSLLHAITNHCFQTLFKMSSEQLKLVMDSIVWAFRHTERNVADTGLNLLYDLLLSFKGSDFATDFHRVYYTTIIREIFAVMTDTFHKPGFKLQARILHHLFTIAREASVVKGPLWEESRGPTAYPNNAAFVNEYVCNLLSTSFPNLSQQQIRACVTGMFEYAEFGVFKNHLRDFLVQTKTFADQNNADLFAEEVELKRKQEAAKLAAIPGMVAPATMPDDGMDA